MVRKWEQEEQQVTLVLRQDLMKLKAVAPVGNSPINTKHAGLIWQQSSSCKHGLVKVTKIFKT